MKATISKVILSFLVLFALRAIAVTHYVDLNSPNPTPPYTNWPTAATNIQHAVDVAISSDEVIVNDGVYAVGGWALYNNATNRVTITNAVLVRSVNGSSSTVIQGSRLPGSKIRCVYLGADATLAGFALTNGETSNLPGDPTGGRAGGVYCASPTAIVSNCVITGNASGGTGGGSFYGCTIIGNTGGFGGGASGSVLSNCVVIANTSTSSSLGGGVYGCTLFNCVLSNNTAGLGSGGGAAISILNDCLIINNSARTGGGLYGNPYMGISNCVFVGNTATDNGGGVYGGVLYDCVLSNNFATQRGGGAALSDLANCDLIRNSAGLSGGGGYWGNLTNCTLTGNSAKDGGGYHGGSGYGLKNCLVIGNWATNSSGGVLSAICFNCTVVGNSATNLAGSGAGTFLNCIVYYNSSPSNPNGGGFSCCSPMGGLTNEPMFLDYLAGDFRLASNSPCINAGWNTYQPSGMDFAGNPRVVGATIDIGAYECQSPALLGYFNWLESYGLSTTAGALNRDSDADGMNNYGEWRSDTIPTNTLSVLRMIGATNSVSGANLTWQSVATRSYWLERATNLGVAPLFQIMATNIPGVTGSKTFTDTSATNGGPYFYRVGVQ